MDSNGNEGHHQEQNNNNNNNQSFEQLDVVCKNVDNIEKMLCGVEIDKNAIEDDLEHLKLDPERGRNSVKRLQQRVNWEAEELMKNLFRLDEMIIGDSPHYRKIRKSLVNRIQRILRYIDNISHSLILLHDSIPQNLSTEKDTNVKKEGKEDVIMEDEKEEPERKSEPKVEEAMKNPIGKGLEKPSEMKTHLEHFERNSQGQYTPKTILIKEEPTFYRVDVKLPGVKKELLDLDIQHSSKTMNLTGSLQVKNGEQVSFSKRFKLPSDVETDKVDARMERDMLEITLPRISKRKQRGRRIR